MADRVKDVARSEVGRIVPLAFRAIKSGAYFYPFQGIVYLLTHQTLRKPLQSRLVPTLTLGIGVTTVMFCLAYVPQMALLALTSGPVVAPVSAALLVINESSAITRILSSSSLLSSFLFSSSRSEPAEPAESVDLDAFDATLILKGHEGLVASGREVRSLRSSNVLDRLGRLVGVGKTNKTSSNNSSSPINRLIRYLLYLPLNFIPVVGTLLFLTLQGKKMGQNALDRYFELKQFSHKQREEWLEVHEGDYISFGMACSLLEMVPFASFVFSCTNTVGAALWAADIENKTLKSTDTGSGSEDQSRKTD